VTSPGIGRPGGSLEGGFRERGWAAIGVVRSALTGVGDPRTLPNHIVVIPFPERSVS